MGSKNRNDLLYDAALEAISDLYSDTSVSREKGIENLNGLKEEINAMIGALENGVDES